MTNSSLYVSELYSRLVSFFFFFFNDTATTEIYTLSLHDALPIYSGDVHVDDELGIRLVDVGGGLPLGRGDEADGTAVRHLVRSEEHTSELQSRLHLVCRLLLEKKKKNRLRDVVSQRET